MYLGSIEMRARVVGTVGIRQRVVLAASNSVGMIGTGIVEWLEWVWTDRVGITWLFPRSRMPLTR